jgi:hypothetical protein
VLGDATLSAVNVVFVVRTDAATLEAEQSHLGAAAVALLLVGLHFYCSHELYVIFDFIFI